MPIITADVTEPARGTGFREVKFVRCCVCSIDGPQRGTGAAACAAVLNLGWFLAPVGDGEDWFCSKTCEAM